MCFKVLGCLSFSLIRIKMEERDIFSSGHPVKVVEAPHDFHVALNSVQFSGPTLDSPAPVSAPIPVSAPVPLNTPVPMNTPVPLNTPVSLNAPIPVSAPVPVSAPMVTTSSTDGKKKRGRPRKYGPDGKVALSPMPISASIPLTGDFSAWKRGRGKPLESSIKKSFKFYEVDVAGPGIKRLHFDSYIFALNLLLVTALHVFSFYVFLCFTVALAVIDSRIFAYF